jgi:hypothetical protein
VCRDNLAALAVRPERPARPLIFALATLAFPAFAAAQQFTFKPAVQWEARADAVIAPASAAQLGIGANVPIGYYVRLGAVVAGGPAWRDGQTAASARLDLTARYLFDPFHEIPWAPYIGGGFTSTWDDPARPHGYLLVVAGVEGPASRGWRTAVEAGLGDGFRLGIVFRRARANGR